MQRRQGPRRVLRRADTAASAPLALRLLYAVVFLTLGAFALVRSLPEWRHLVRALSGPLHWGTPPSVPLLLAGLFAVVGLVPLALALLRRRPAPLLLSGLLLLACLLALAPAVSSAERSVARANAALLACAQEVRTALSEAAQRDANVPGEAATRTLIEKSCPATLRDQTFARTSPRLNWLTDERVPTHVAAGTLSVFRSGDGVRFALHPTGWKEGGGTMPLPNARGEPLWFKGAYLPAF